MTKIKKYINVQIKAKQNIFILNKVFFKKIFFRKKIN